MAEKLAILGGESIVPEGIWKPWPFITEDDKNAMAEIVEKIANGAITWAPWGEQIKGLEQEWAEYLGIKHCLATCSGTMALSIAVAAANIQPGDEVITSAFTFIGSALPSLYRFAIPVFVDIAPETYNIDPNRIEENISEKTKAIIPVHIQGLSADMDPIMEIAEKHDLIVIEDACQAHGAEYKGSKVGTIGQMAGFSLNGLKNLCGGEGGLFVTDDDDFCHIAHTYRGFGGEYRRYGSHRYDMVGIGWMGRNHEIPSAFVRARLRHLDFDNDWRIRNCEYLTRELSKIKGIIPPAVPEGYKHVYFMYTFRVNPDELGIDMPVKQFRDAVKDALLAEGVPVGLHMEMPLPAEKLFQSKKAFENGYPWTLPVANEVDYSPENYPVATRICDDHIRFVTVPDLQGAVIERPNDLTTMEHFVNGVKKVFNNLEQVIEHASQPKG